MKNNVYILGAGASAVAGVPVMSNFIQKARDYYRKKLPIKSPLVKKYSDVEEYIDNISSSRNYLDIDLHNIESVYSLIDMGHIVEKSNYSLQESMKYYIWKTIEYYTPIPKIGNHYPNRAFWEESLIFKSNEVRNTIITFNYDMVMEYTLRTLYSRHPNIETKCVYKYPGIDRSIKLADYDAAFGEYDKYANYEGRCGQKAEVDIIKLHGSVNWLTGKATPLIVPPTWKKGQQRLLDNVWKCAYDAIARATNIIFIGYSLPDTDSYFRNLLTLALSKTKTLHKIIVLNAASENSETAHRYSSLIDNNFARNREGLIYLGKSLENLFSTPNWNGWLDIQAKILA